MVLEIKKNKNGKLTLFVCFRSLKYPLDCRNWALNPQIHKHTVTRGAWRELTLEISENMTKLKWKWSKAFTSWSTEVKTLCFSFIWTRSTPQTHTYMSRVIIYISTWQATLIEKQKSENNSVMHRMTWKRSAIIISSSSQKPSVLERFRSARHRL